MLALATGGGLSEASEDDEEFDFASAAAADEPPDGEPFLLLLPVAPAFTSALAPASGLFFPIILDSRNASTSASPPRPVAAAAPPAALLAKSRDWQKLGASIFGGCCGIGAEHIAVLADEIR